MRGTVIAAVIGLGLASTGCIAGAPGCLIVVPARYDIGTSHVAGRDGAGVHVGIGASWASVAENPRTPVDVAFGYVIELRPDVPAGVAAPARASPSAPALGSYWGGYLELAARAFGTAHQRAFVGVRAEVLTLADSPGPDYGVGATARIGWELLRAGRAATWIGALAGGVFVEASSRRFDAERIEHSVVFGLSVRVPMKVVVTKGRHRE